MEDRIRIRLFLKDRNRIRFFFSTGFRFFSKIESDQFFLLKIGIGSGFFSKIGSGFSQRSDSDPQPWRTTATTAAYLDDWGRRFQASLVGSNSTICGGTRWSGGKLDIICTKCPKIYRKSVLHLPQSILRQMEYRFAVNTQYMSN